MQIVIPFFLLSIDPNASLLVEAFDSLRPTELGSCLYKSNKKVPLPLLPVL